MRENAIKPIKLMLFIPWFSLSLFSTFLHTCDDGILRHEINYSETNYQYNAGKQECIGCSWHNNCKSETYTLKITFTSNNFTHAFQYEQIVLRTFAFTTASIRAPPQLT